MLFVQPIMAQETTELSPGLIVVYAARWDGLGWQEAVIATVEPEPCR